MIAELIDDGLTQHSFPLAVDEHDLGALVFLVLLQRASHHLQLVVEDVGGAHTSRGLEDFSGMEVDHNRFVLAPATPHRCWLAGRGGIKALLLAETLLQLLGVDNQRTGGFVAFHNGIEQGILLKEIVLDKGVTLVELHGLNAQLHVNQRFQQEGFVALVSHELHAHALPIVERVTSKLLQIELGVRLHLCLVAQFPRTAFNGQEGEVEVIVAVVDEIDLEVRLVETVDIHRHKGKIGGKHIPSPTLLCRCLEGDGTFVFFLLTGTLGCFLLRLVDHANHALRVIVLFVDNNHLAEGHGHLKTVGILHEDNILGLESGHSAAANLIDKFYLISNFHAFRIILSCSMMPFFVSARIVCSGNDQTAVAIAQKTEIMGQGIIVDLPPVALDKSAHQEQQGALRLVEIGDEHLHYMELIAGDNDDLGARMESWQVVTIKIVEQRTQGLDRSDFGMGLIRFPLGHMKLFFAEVGTGDEFGTHIIEALQRAHTRRAHRDSFSIMGDEPFQGAPTHTDKFGVHRVAFYLLALHGLEGAGPHMQRQFLALQSVGIQVGQHPVGEMESGGGRRHTALDFRVDGLIGLLVALLCGTVEIGRDGQFAYRLEQFGPADLRVVPIESDTMTGGMCLQPGGSEHYLDAAHGDGQPQRSLLPLLQVAHQTKPLAMAAALEHLLIIGRGKGLQQEYLDEGSRLLAEMEASLDDLRVVAYDQRTSWKIGRQMIEMVFAHTPLPVDQQLRVVALGQGEFGNPIIGQRIVKILDSYMFYIHSKCTFRLIPLQNYIYFFFCKMFFHFFLLKQQNNPYLCIIIIDLYVIYLFFQL